VLRVLATAAAVALFVAGCGSDEEPAATPAATTDAPSAQTTEPFGEYEREVIQAEIDRTAETPQPPPAGTYRLTLSSGTIVVVLPDGFSIAQELTATGGALTIGRYIGEGGFCPDDRESSYGWEIAGGELVLSPRTESCGDREAILAGTWKMSR
jgi:hypothetical protein